MTENFSRLMSNNNQQAQGAQRIPSRLNAKKTKKQKNPTPRHFIFKLQKLKDKEKNPQKRQRGKKNTYGGTKIRITFNVSLETMQALQIELKEKIPQTQNSVSCEIILQKRRKNKDLSRQTKIEGICCQICLAKNVKRSPERRKMTKARNSELHKERKNIRA